MVKQQSDNTPLVNIVMATYNPRMDWFEEQLKSLNDQTYENIKITIIDDCSNAVYFQDIKAYVEKHITKFPFTIQQNEKNLGSNKTFEKLTEMADGEYIAYCDQDDIWHKDKLEISLANIIDSEGVLVFSDMNIIDEKDRKTANSITEIRRHHKFKSGSELSETLLFRNFVSGCTMLISTEIAKNAIPFCPYMVHDHYLALWSSIKGNLVFINESLLEYRIHNSNQTLVMAGVNDKKTYVEVRIKTAHDKFIWLKEQKDNSKDLEPTISQAIEWVKAREENFGKLGKSILIIWKYRRFGFATSLFEIVASILPEKAFLFFITLVKKNII